VARELGADLVVIHPGYEFVDENYRKRFPDKGTFEKAAESIAEIAEYAIPSGIKLCLENLRHEGAIGSSPERLSRIVKLARDKCSSKSAGKLIGATIDLGHLNTTAKYGVSDYLRALDGGRDVYHAHLHYNNGKDDEHLPMIRVDPVWEAKLTALGNGLSRLATSTMEINPLEESDVTGSIDTLYKNKYFRGHKCPST
jgi:sugar phosphate isomerase/epimerase